MDNQTMLKRLEDEQLEPETIMSNLTCHCCGTRLYKGEMHIEIKNLIYCECCIDEMPIRYLLGLFGIELEWEEA